MAALRMIVLAAVVGLAVASDNKDENGVCHIGFWYDAATQECEPCTNDKPEWSVYLTNGGDNDCLYGCAKDHAHIKDANGTEWCQKVPTKSPTSFPTSFPTANPTANPTPTCVPCYWSAWSEATQCSTTCGKGVSHQMRHLLPSIPDHDPNCPCTLGIVNSTQSRTLECHSEECANQDCIMGPWSTWMHPDPKFDLIKKNIWQEDNYKMICETGRGSNVHGGSLVHAECAEEAIRLGKSDRCSGDTGTWGIILGGRQVVSSAEECAKSCEDWTGKIECEAWTFKAKEGYCFKLDHTATTAAVVAKQDSQSAWFKDHFQSAICKKMPTNLLVHRTRDIDMRPVGEGKACRATLEYKPWHDHCYHVMGAEKNERQCENFDTDCADPTDTTATTRCKHHASRCDDMSFSRVDVHYHKNHACADLRDRTELP